MRATGGGAATAGGIAYQARVAAWAAARILAEERAVGVWGFPSTSLVGLYCETGGGVDDLLLVTSAAGQLFVQAKRQIDLGQNASSELASYVAQCVRQHRVGRLAIGSSGARAGGTLDWSRDRLVLVTSPGASAGVRVHLRAVLERGRELPVADSVDALATNQDERRARDVVMAHLRRAWEQEPGSAPSVRQLRQVLALMQVEVLDVEPGGDGEREAQTLLGPGVLTDPSQRATAWTTLVDFCANLMRRRSGTDRRGLQQVLEDVGAAVDPAHSYEGDITRLRARSAATSQRLAHLATIPAGADEVRIDRPAAVHLRQVVATGSCLVIGEPGAGKSAALHQLAGELVSQGEDVVYLAVDDLTGQSLGALRQDLGLEHELVDVLEAWTGPGPAYLLIDALDVARVQGNARAYRQLLREVTSQEGRWRVVCSIRKFDLRYSAELQQLFSAQQPLQAPEEFQDPEFIAIRHLNIPALSPAELAQLELQAPALWQLLQAARPPLQGLLRVPFNLRLAAELLQLGLTIGELTPIRTQLELLDRYWQRRVLGVGQQGDANEAVLRRACERMVSARTLQVARSDLADPASSPALDTLLSAQVLVEWQSTASAQPDRQVLAFAHHLLFDYAVAQLLLAGLPGTATRLLRADPELALVVRPSMLLHFHRLWALDPVRRRFWDETLGMVADDTVPEIAKLLGPLAAVELAEALSDLDPLSAALDQDSEPAASAFGHLVGALNLSLATSDWLSPTRAACWCAMAERVSRAPGDRVAYPLRIMVLDLCEHRRTLSELDLQWLAAAARRLLEFAWARTPRDPVLVTAGLQAVSRSFAGDPTSGDALLRQALQPHQLREHGFEEMPRLTQELAELVRHDPSLVSAIYVAVLSYDESRTDPAPMSRSRILSLVSNIRQDFDHAKWKLGEFFPALLQQAPMDAIRTLLETLDALADTGSDTSEQPFDFDGAPTAVRDDRGQRWDWDWGEFARTDPVVKMLDGFQRYLEDRAARDDRPFLQEAVTVVIGANRSSTVWKRLLALGAQHPTTLGVLLAPLAWATPILAGPATRSTARQFVHAVFPLLDAPDRTRVEQTILSLRAATVEIDPDWITDTRNRLLSGLDQAHLTTDAARALRSELDAEANVADAAPSPAGWLPDTAETPSTERHLHAAGVDLTSEDTQRLLQFIRPVEAFLEAATTEQQSMNIMESLRELLASLTAPATTQVDPRVSSRAWELASQAASKLAQGNDVSCTDPGVQLVRELLLAASRHPEPVAEDNEDLEADTVLIWTYAPRTNAAGGLMTLGGVPTCADAQLLDVIQRLATDPAPRVRFQVASGLNRLYQTARPIMWELAQQFAHHEPTSGVLQVLVGALGRLGRAEPEQTATLLAVIYERTRGINVHLDSDCLSLLGAIWARQGTPEAGRALEQAIQQVLSADRLGHILHTLRDGLTYGPTDVADPAADQVRERSFGLVSQLVTRGHETLTALQAAWQTASPSEEDVALAREAASILDVAMNELYFASGAYDRQSSTTSGAPRAPLPVHERFYREADDLLDQMAEVQLPSVTHHLVQTLEFFVPLDPRGVFLRIDHAVAQGGQQGGYQLESLAVGTIVALIRRYLADYRALLHQDADCRRTLQRILDGFVAVGWPEARRLTYQLDDIFR
jgi:hypothetical protein